MTIEQSRNLYQARPFRPFVIHLEDGRKLSVSRAEQLSHSPSGKSVCVFNEDDTFSMIDLALITDLEVQSAD